MKTTELVKLDLYEKIWRLTLEGKSQSEIAQVVGLTQPRISQILNKEIIPAKQQALETHRQIQFEKCQELINENWERATGGNSAAAQTVLKAMDHQAKLYGLYKAQELQASGGTIVYERVLMALAERVEREPWEIEREQQVAAYSLELEALNGEAA
ncbi:hypothetical protein ABZS66_36335 [Dactylosporangium sp. NPDC005572]|uniref:hypothetical protein n=1 Tax=Dactylosporangium sp. NPDC005572 TaxID=3156889 RepID=UPI0033B2D3DD